MNIGQPKKHSAFEAIINIFIGYWIGFLAQIIVFPFYDIKISFMQNITMSIIFTIISLIRSYAIRRIFNNFHLEYLQRKNNENSRG